MNILKLLVLMEILHPCPSIKRGYSVLHWPAIGMHNKDEIIHFFVDIYGSDVEHASNVSATCLSLALKTLTH